MDLLILVSLLERQRHFQLNRIRFGIFEGSRKKAIKLFLIAQETLGITQLIETKQLIDKQIKLNNIYLDTFLFLDNV